METEKLLQQARALIDDLPKNKMDPQSKLFAETNYADWVVSRNRLMDTAILNDDLEVVEMVTDEVAHLIGIQAAERWKINKRGRIVAELLGIQSNLL